MEMHASSSIMNSIETLFVTHISGQYLDGYTLVIFIIFHLVIYELDCKKPNPPSQYFAETGLKLVRRVALGILKNQT